MNRVIRFFTTQRMLLFLGAACLLTAGVSHFRQDPLEHIYDSAASLFYLCFGGYWLWMTSNDARMEEIIRLKTKSKLLIHSLLPMIAFVALGAALILLRSHNPPDRVNDSVAFGIIFMAIGTLGLAITLFQWLRNEPSKPRRP